MPVISLCFQGWLRGIRISKVMECPSGEMVDVSKMDAKTVVAKLKSGEYAASLRDLLNNIPDDEEIELHDFEAYGEDLEELAIVDCQDTGHGAYRVEALEKFLVSTVYDVFADSPADAVAQCKSGKVSYERHSIEEGEDEWLETVKVSKPNNT